MSGSLNEESFVEIQFKNKVVVVTGGAGGFGSATARSFAAAGAHVVVTDINVDGAKKVADELPSAEAAQLDVTSPESIGSFFADLAASHGGLDVLVNNAGAPRPKMSLEETSLEDIDWLIHLNYRSAILASKAALPLLRQRTGSSIVNVGSISGRRPRGGGTIYNSAKAGVEAFTKALAAEVAPLIRVNAVSPVIAETGFVQSIYGRDSLTGADRARLVTGIPMGRTAVPQDIANAILYLASEPSNFLTGVCLQVDGGRSIS